MYRNYDSIHIVSSYLTPYTNTLRMSLLSPSLLLSLEPEAKRNPRAIEDQYQRNTLSYIIIKQTPPKFRLTQSHPKSAVQFASSPSSDPIDQSNADTMLYVCFCLYATFMWNRLFTTPSMVMHAKFYERRRMLICRSFYTAGHRFRNPSAHRPYKTSASCLVCSIPGMT